MTMPQADGEGRLHPSYVVVIRRASDGLERRCEMAHGWHSASAFWWEDGNMACDCNRGDAFDRAGGETDAAIVAKLRPCSSEAFLVVRFEFPDGTSVPGPDA